MKLELLRENLITECGIQDEADLPLGAVRIMRGFTTAFYPQSIMFIDECEEEHQRSVPGGQLIPLQKESN